jgi:protein TonB
MAFAASAGVMLAAMAALATLNVVAQHKAASRLTVVAMKQLDTLPPPPPPPPKSLEKPVVQPPQAFIPKPMIEVPSPGPTQVALDVPAPPSAPVVATPRIVAAAGPVAEAAPAASADPVEGGDLSSQVLSAKPPTYPIDARRRREQGTVKLMVLVGPDGRVSDIQLAGSSGSQALDRAALGAVKRWRWSPQKKGGVPVAVRGYVTIPFVLTS